MILYQRLGNQAHRNQIPSRANFLSSNRVAGLHLVDQIAVYHILELFFPEVLRKTTDKLTVCFDTPNVSMRPHSRIYTR